MASGYISSACSIPKKAPQALFLLRRTYDVSKTSIEASVKTININTLHNHKLIEPVAGICQGET